MAQHWTSRVTRTASKMGRVFRTELRPSGADDADARRMESDLGAIRARFSDHG